MIAGSKRGDDEIERRRKFRKVTKVEWSACGRLFDNT